MTEACGAWCPFMACSRCKWQGWICQSCGKGCDQGEVVCDVCANYKDVV